MLSYVVDQQRANCAPVIGTGDGAVSLLTCCVPDLRFNFLVFRKDALRGKFYSDCSSRVLNELILGKPGQKI